VSDRDIKYGVITNVPDLDGDGMFGNVSLPMNPFYYVTKMGDKSTDYVDVIKKMTGIEMLMLRIPVFILSEILILDLTGREVAGYGRKPDKWSVTCEEFDTIEEALARAKEVGD